MPLVHIFYNQNPLPLEFQLLLPPPSQEIFRQTVPFRIKSNGLHSLRLHRASVLWGRKKQSGDQKTEKKSGGSGQKAISRDLAQDGQGPLVEVDRQTLRVLADAFHEGVLQKLLSSRKVKLPNNFSQLLPAFEPAIFFCVETLKNFSKVLHWSSHPGQHGTRARVVMLEIKINKGSIFLEVYLEKS